MISISDILERIEGPSEDARFAAWMEIYSSESPEAQEQMEQIVESRNPLLKISLIRFLARIPELKAMIWLRQIIQDENTVVAESARRSIEKNSFDDKLKVLLPLLESRSILARNFSIEKLSAGGVYEIIPTLLRLLENADDALTEQLLSAFRHLPDRRLLPAIQTYLASSRTEFRFKALLALISLYEGGYPAARKMLLACLQDADPMIRKTTLWGMRRKPDRRDLKPIISLSLSDPQSLVRQESLAEMGFFPTTPVIRHLLKVMTTDKDNTVVLKAEGLLLSMPPKAILKALRKELRVNEFNFQDRALLLLVEFDKKSNRTFRFLTRGLRKAPNGRRQMAFIEALGYFQDKRALPILDEYLDKNPSLAYAALTAILKIAFRHRLAILIKYLQAPALPDVLKQMILKSILTKGSEGLSPEDLMQTLLNLLQSDNLNIRYLSAQVLVKIKAAGIQQPVLEMILAEKDTSISKYFTESFRHLLSHNPAASIDVLQHNASRPEALSLALSVLREVEFTADESQAVIQAVLSLPLNSLHPEHLEMLSRFLTVQVRCDRIPLEDLLNRIHGLQEKKDILPFLVRDLQAKPRLPLKVPLVLLRGWIGEDIPKQTEAILELVALNQGRSSIPFLVSITADDRLKRFHHKASEALNHLIEASV